MHSSLRPFCSLIVVSLSFLFACGGEKKPEGSVVKGSDVTMPETGAEDPEGVFEETGEEAAVLSAEWPRQVGGSDLDVGQDVVNDADGNVYVAVRTRPADDLQVLLLKYDPSGRELWRRVLAGEGDKVAVALAKDDHGDLYLAGMQPEDPDAPLWRRGIDLFVSKFTSDGDVLWTTVITSEVDERVVDMVQTAGFLYLAGRTDKDVAVWRVDVEAGAYDPAVDLFEYEGYPSSDEVAGIAADADGQLFVAGTTFDGIAKGFCFMIRTDLVPLAAFTIPSHFGVQVASVATDGNKVYLGGTTESADLSHPEATLGNGHREGFVAKYNRLFQLQWVSQTEGRNAPEIVTDLAVTLDGDVLAAGLQGDYRANRDVFLRRLNGDDGTTLFTKTIATDHEEDMRAVASGPAGEAFVVGSTRGVLNPSDVDRDPTVTADEDAFVFAMDAAGNSL